MQLPDIEPKDRLIVSLDPNPKSAFSAADTEREMVRLARALAGTGVCVKLNWLLRLYGYQLIERMRSEFGLEVFADLKLFDIYPTMVSDALCLASFRPKFLTVHAMSGVASMRAVLKSLPDTQVFGVTILTEQDSKYTDWLFNIPLDDAVMRLADKAFEAGLEGIICAPGDLLALRDLQGSMALVTPNIRPTWVNLERDFQNPARAMTPFDAIKAGAQRIIVGSPIMQSATPRDATLRVIDEIAAALQKMGKN